MTFFYISQLILNLILDKRAIHFNKVLRKKILIPVQQVHIKKYEY